MFIMKNNIVCLGILVIILEFCTDLSAANPFDIDACYYETNTQAGETWKGTYPVITSDNVKINELSALLLPCEFKKQRSLCTWQKYYTNAVDLSPYPYIYLSLYIKNAEAIQDYGLYFGVMGNDDLNQITGWYAHIKRLHLQEGWNILTLKCSDFTKEGTVPVDGWKQIKAVRLSFWGMKDNSNAQITVKAIQACQVPPKNDVNLTKSEGTLMDRQQIPIIPVPQSVEWMKDVFRCSKTDIPVHLTKNESVQRVYDVVRTDFAECTFRQKASINDDGMIAIIGNTSEVSQEILSGIKNKVKFFAEGYYLEVGKNYIILIGKDEAGFYYGFQTLRQIWMLTSTGVTVNGVKIIDYPSLSMRGLYLHRMRTAEGTLSKVKMIIKGLSAMKINMLFIDIASDMQYDKYQFPVTSPHPYTKAQMKDLAAFARRHYVTICPYYQMFMHMPWIAEEPQYRHLLEGPKQWNWYTSWCPSNPETYTFAESLINEAIDVFQPPYVHIGHDEMAFADPPVGTCERCKGKSRESLIAESMNHLCDFIESKGIKAIVWDDTFNPWAHELTPPKQLDGDKLIDMVRRTIVINCWYYGYQKENLLKQIHRFQEHKYKDIIISPFVNEKNIKITSEQAKATGIMGGICTLWHEWGSFGSYPNNISDKALPAIGMGAAYYWNSNSPVISLARYDWNYKVRCFMEPNKSLDSDTEMNFNTVHWTDDIKKLTRLSQELQKISLPTSVDVGLLPFRSISPIILSGIKEETEYPVKVEIPINQKTESVYFLHTLTEPFDRKKWEYYTDCTSKPEVGRYTMVYEDNTKEVILLNYRWNINSWNSAYGVPDGFIAWQGVDINENLFRLYGLTWTNPSPQKRISHIEFTSTQEDGMNPVLLGISVGSKHSK